MYQGDDFADQVRAIGELIDAALAGDLPEGAGREFPRWFDRKDTLQSVGQYGKFKDPFMIIKGGKGADL